MNDVRKNATEEGEKVRQKGIYQLNKNGKGTNDFPSLDTFVALRKNEDTFRWFAFRFLECVAGVNASWKKQK